MGPWAAVRWLTLRCLRPSPGQRDLTWPPGIRPARHL